jgi:hypothetical protein
VLFEFIEKRSRPPPARPRYLHVITSKTRFYESTNPKNCFV